MKGTQCKLPLMPRPHLKTLQPRQAKIPKARFPCSRPLALGLTAGCDDKGLTDEQKASWFETTQSNKLFPPRIMGKSSRDVNKPDYVPRAKTIAGVLEDQRRRRLRQESPEGC